jgi:uncharacterized damage-inducible protein DinB
MEQRQIFIQMAMKAWNIHINRVNKFLEEHTDESLSNEIAPGKNSIVYLLGHLIATNDTMLSLFGGTRQYANFDEAFVINPDKSGLPMPDASFLRTEWKKSIQILTDFFEKMSAEDWFSKHAVMTDEDLVKEPGRNKLSVLINRTNHVAYHLGQLVLAK